MSEGRAGVRRWRRTGHDRLYVTGPDGTALGYLDTITELPCGVPAGRAEEFHAALAAYRVGPDLGRVRSGPQAPAQPGPPPALGGTRHRTGCSTMTRTPISRSRTAHRPLAPPPRGGRHPRGRGTT